MKENLSLGEQSSGGEGEVGNCEKEVKVKDDAPTMSVLGVCTGNSSLYCAYKVLSKYLLNRVQFLSLLCPSPELLLCPRLNIGFRDVQSWLTSPLCHPESCSMESDCSPDPQHRDVKVRTKPRDASQHGSLRLGHHEPR